MPQVKRHWSARNQSLFPQLCCLAAGADHIALVDLSDLAGERSSADSDAESLARGRWQSCRDALRAVSCIEVVKSSAGRRFLSISLRVSSSAGRDVYCRLS